MAAAYAALVSVMHIIDQLQHHPRPPISLHKTQVDSLTRKVTFLQEFLESYNFHVGYTTEADPLESRIADAAYAAEDMIESHIVDQITNHEEKISSDSLYSIRLEMVIEEMNSIEKEAMEIQETMGVQHQLHRISMTPIRSSSTEKNCCMVGVDDVLLDMMDKLTGGQLDLRIIPIFGMAGIGKTALARNIFRKPLIKEHFHICAWATISQEYNVREIFTQALSHVDKKGSKYLSVDELGGMLYKYIWGRKYLIILDDLWSIEAWDEVRRFFPDNKNGSRIVITTRLSNLASKLTSSNSLEMRLLDKANSWDLLYKTVFGEESCPFELEEMGEKIAKSCKGLPLSIVVIGGCLANSKHTREFWEYIEENLNSIVNLEDNERCLKILHMSYRELPIYLKSCFLYMGVFPEDNVIRVSRLIKLWVAEGFLKPISGKSLEEIAKEYLTGLIGRNLILVHESGSTDENIKYCKIHDLLRDFCLREAQKERFYNVVRPHTQRRVVISRSTSKEEIVDALQSMSLARSLIWEFEEPLPSLSFRLLRILDAPKSRSINSLESMLQLVNSRYLAFTTHREWSGWECKFPSSIYRLWNLQTLIVSGLEGTTAPAEIWCMPQIRHVVFRGLHLPDPPSGEDGIILGNLQTLVTIKDFNGSEEVVKRIPNIKKLRLSYHGFVRWYLPSNLECLHKLESLGCFCFPKISTGPEFLQSLSFPHSLKKLTLQIGRSNHWQHILEKIGALPLLEKLKLYLGVFEGCKWETVEGQFRSLKFLEIRNCRGLKLWTVESSHFPCLEHLVLQGLRVLNEIPLGFAEIPTLGLIELKFCSDSAVISAKRIVEEQEELYGEVALQVRVMISKKNEAVESLASPNFRVECWE